MHLARKIFVSDKLKGNGQVGGVGLPSRGVCTISKFVATLEIDGVAFIPALNMKTETIKRTPVSKNRRSTPKNVRRILLAILPTSVEGGH